MSPSRVAPRRLAYQPPGDPFDVEVLTLDALQQRATRTQLAAPSRADFLRLIGMTGAPTDLVVDFRRETLSARSWRLVQPGQVLQYGLHDDTRGWLVVFRPEAWLPQAGPGLTDHAHAVQVDARTHRLLLAACARMQADSGAALPHDVRARMLRWQLALLLTRLGPIPAPGPTLTPSRQASRRTFERFEARLAKHVATDHQVQGHADALHVSARTLNRAVQAERGVSAKAWIDARLLLEARRLLAHGDASVESVGASLGFGDPSNFVRFFRQRDGRTPAGFRAAVRAGLNPGADPVVPS